MLLKQKLGLELSKEKGEQKKAGLFLELKDMVAVGCLMRRTCFEVENKKVL